MKPEPLVEIGWPCPRCDGAAVDEHGRRCTRCVNSPGLERQEWVPLSRLKQLLADS